MKRLHRETLRDDTERQGDFFGGEVFWKYGLWFFDLYGLCIIYGFNLSHRWYGLNGF